MLVFEVGRGFNFEEREREGRRETRDEKETRKARGGERRSSAQGNSEEGYSQLPWLGTKRNQEREGEGTCWPIGTEVPLSYDWWLLFFLKVLKRPLCPSLIRTKSPVCPPIKDGFYMQH